MISKSIAKKVAVERTLATHHIGEVAGEIWQLLSAKEAQTLAAMKKSIAAPADVIVAAVGWLRGKASSSSHASGKTLKISLKP